MATTNEKNTTGLKTLDRAARDPRVTKVYADSDGIWVDLADGYNFEGCSSLRGDTVRDVLDDYRMIEEAAVDYGYPEGLLP